LVRIHLEEGLPYRDVRAQRLVYQLSKVAQVRDSVFEEDVFLPQLTLMFVNLVFDVSIFELAS